MERKRKGDQVLSEKSQAIKKTVQQTLSNLSKVTIKFIPSLEARPSWYSCHKCGEAIKDQYKTKCANCDKHKNEKNSVTVSKVGEKAEFIDLISPIKMNSGGYQNSKVNQELENMLEEENRKHVAKPQLELDLDLEVEEGENIYPWG